MASGFLRNTEDPEDCNCSDYHNVGRNSTDDEAQTRKPIFCIPSLYFLPLGWETKFHTHTKPQVKLQSIF